MKATIHFDEHLYRRLKVEAARRGRTVRDLVAEGVQRVLDSPSTASPLAEGEGDTDWRPPWFGTLASHARAVDDHSMTAIRASIAAKRGAERSANRASTRRR